MVGERRGRLVDGWRTPPSHPMVDRVREETCCAWRLPATRVVSQGPPPILRRDLQWPRNRGICSHLWSPRTVRGARPGLLAVARPGLSSPARLVLLHERALGGSPAPPRSSACTAARPRRRVNGGRGCRCRGAGCAGPARGHHPLGVGRGLRRSGPRSLTRMPPAVGVLPTGSAALDHVGGPVPASCGRRRTGVVRSRWKTTSEPTV